MTTSEMSIELQGISKQFKGTQALHKIHAAFEAGSIHGLLGRNGAGKTTLLNIMAGYDLANQGSVVIDGTVLKDQQSLIQQICYVRETEKPWEEYKLKKLLTFFKLNTPNWDEEYAMALMSRYQLNPNKKYSQLSRGMKSLFGAIRGLASRSPITLFDEPVLGLDAAMRQMFYDDLLEDYTKHPRTILISTHLIDESEQLFEYITFIHQGQITLQGATDAILQRGLTLSGRKEAVERAIQGKQVLHTEQLGGHVGVLLWDVPEEEQRAWQQSGLDIGSASLQKLFVHLTAQSQHAKGGHQ
ncbi:ATP-binding cassette domain-containing protein [Paenibacillus aquistagni]|uniref:ATP-binding cassette domain-containing protein n=1 Tax=Paenibacillus aquistagni TaxID=1852522 RepID=UPI00145C1627|nr:ABC transporter ATP-binding protein [Paenibacillus aquistagni]NMM51928.1 ABC transporter ATP-binding protein [Paenibacillus aquistagni]